MQKTRQVKNPRKQRKFLHNAPAHLRHKLMAAPLSKELAASKGAKTLPVRKGDTIRIMRGDHVGFEGKVSRIDLKRYRIFVEGLTREKVDGTNIFVAVHPSKVMIKGLNLDDKWRKAILERKTEMPKKEEKVVKKPAKKAVEVKEEKPVEAKVAAQEKLAEKKPKVTKKKVQKKPAAKKKKEMKPKAEEKPAVKEEKPKAAKKTRAKRKTASKTEGGT
jgi:large subunit ribosomal protein L24